MWRFLGKNTQDDEAIRAFVERQFGSLNWSPTARPAKSQKPEELVERMKD
jgi:hypothetical protein